MHGFEVSVVHACSGVPGVVMGLLRLFCTWAQASGLHDTRRVNLREHRAIVSTNKPRAPGRAKDVSVIRGVALARLPAGLAVRSRRQPGLVASPTGNIAGHDCSSGRESLPYVHTRSRT